MSAMSKEEILKNQITSKYKSVLAFAKETGIPESSIRNIFNRGLESVNAGTLVEICRHLSLDIESLMEGTLSVRPNSQKDEAWEQYLGKKNEPATLSDSELDNNLYNLLGQLTPTDLEKVAAFVQGLLAKS